jgi:diketogulonate reductase-like aldo/keto reductase
MRYETVSGLSLPKIGLGTWSLGGGWAARPSLNRAALSALRAALEIGYSHFDTAETYAAGHSEELLGQAILESGASRESLFITSKVAPEHLRREQVLRSCEASLRRVRIDYLDLYLIHWPRRGMRLDQAFAGLNHLVAAGKVRHLGVSNFNLALLREAQQFSATPILTNQVPYSLADRSNAKNGVLEHCRANDILLTAYSPLDQGSFRPSARVRAIAKERGVTPEQIALAWLVGQPRVITIPMSADPKHLRLNFDAAEIDLSPAEIESLGHH